MEDSRKQTINRWGQSTCVKRRQLDMWLEFFLAKHFFERTDIVLAKFIHSSNRRLSECVLLVKRQFSDTDDDAYKSSHYVLFAAAQWLPCWVQAKLLPPSMATMRPKIFCCLRWTIFLIFCWLYLQFFASSKVLNNHYEEGKKKKRWIFLEEIKQFVFKMWNLKPFSRFNVHSSRC